MNENMNYLCAIGLMLLGLSPLAVPVGITVYGAVADRWPTNKQLRWNRRQSCAVGATA